MTILIARVKDFLNILKEVYDKEYSNRLLPMSIATGKSNSEQMKYYKVSQKERVIFRAFHEQVTQVSFKEPPC